MKNFFSKEKFISSGLLFQATGAKFIPIAPGVDKSSKLTQLYSGTDLVSFIQSIFYFSLTVGAILAIGRIVYAGYLYMGENMWSKGKAKGIIGEVILGTLLLLAVWLILYQINPDILNLDVLAPIKGAKVTGLSAPVPADSVQGTASGLANCTYADPKTGVCLVRN